MWGSIAQKCFYAFDYHYFVNTWYTSHIASRMIFIYVIKIYFYFSACQTKKQMTSDTDDRQLRQNLFFSFASMKTWEVKYFLAKLGPQLF